MANPRGYQMSDNPRLR